MQPALYKALRCQILAVLVVFLLGQTGVLPPIDALALAALQGIFASFLALITKADRWWLPLHLVLLPGVVMAAQLHLPANLYGLLFLTLFCIYWTTFRTRVPLFLSNRASVHRLAVKFPFSQHLNVLDVGSGTGSFVIRLALLRPTWHIEGCELAPIPFLLSRWLARGTPNATLTRQDFWKKSLSGFDVVYAFLSPVPMEALWRKARQEMAAGSMFVSNSFPVPGRTADSVIEVGDRRQTQLFCYRIPDRGRK